jgi:hypothetical protein
VDNFFGGVCLRFEGVCLRAPFPWKPALPYLILAVISALYLYPFVCSFNDALDAGIYLNGADLVNGGALPSRDFVELQGPGSFVWLALFFHLFGTTLATAQTVLIGTGTALTLLTFYLSRRLGATGFCAALFVAVISVPLLPINSPHYDSNLLALSAFTLFLLALDSVSIWQLAASATLCGFTTWTIQQKGFYLAVALLASLALVMRWRARRPALIFTCVYATASGLPFVFSAAHHALSNVLYANFIWPLRSYAQTNAAPYGFPIWQNLRAIVSSQTHTPFNWLADAVSIVPFLVVAALPLLLPLTAKFGGRHWFRKPLLPYWLAAYALWFSELQRLDMGHLRNAILLLAILFFSICEADGNRWLRRAGLAITVCAALSGASHFLISVGDTQASKHITRRGEIYLKTDGARLLDFLASHTKPGDYLFLYPYQPIYYFVEDLRNPTRFSNLMYGMNTDAQFIEATRDLERKHVRYVVVDRVLLDHGLSSAFPAYRQPPKAKLIMEPYLESHYRVLNDLGRFQILERKE